jgi:mutator protein MutT
MGAGIMVRCGGEVLILKRANYKEDKYAGYWNFPGGTADEGETPYETAVRETREEIGVSTPYIKIVDHIGDRIYTMFIGHVPIKFKPIIDHEHTDWRWIPISEVSHIENFHPKDKRLFERLNVSF